MAGELTMCTLWGQYQVSWPCYEDAIRWVDRATVWGCYQVNWSRYDAANRWIDRAMRPLSDKLTTLWWYDEGGWAQLFITIHLFVRTYIYRIHALLLESCCPVYYVVLYHYINSSCSFLTSLGSCPCTYAHPPSLLLYSSALRHLSAEKEKKIKFQKKKKKKKDAMWTVIS